MAETMLLHRQWGAEVAAAADVTIELPKIPDGKVMQLRHVGASNGTSNGSAVKICINSAGVLFPLFRSSLSTVGAQYSQAVNCYVGPRERIVAVFNWAEVGDALSVYAHGELYDYEAG